MAKSTRKTTAAQELYSSVTAKIIADMEQGELVWRKPWSVAGFGSIIRPLRATGETYRGMNILLLWMAAMEKGYNHAVWMTFNQARALDAPVRKGEKASKVCFFNTLDTLEEDPETGELEPAKVPYMKVYSVFNAEQLESMPRKFAPGEAKNQITEDARIENVEAFFRKIPAVTLHQGSRAFYRPSTDVVTMPPFERFESGEAYYATLAHELAHWTGAATRLDRPLAGNGRGTKAEYAFEELVAELGAAFLCARIGIAETPRKEHAAYLQHWIALLKQDDRAIFRAAAQAQRAVDYLLDVASGEDRAEAA